MPIIVSVWPRIHNTISSARYNTRHCLKSFIKDPPLAHTHTSPSLLHMASIMMLIAVVLSCVYLSSATYLPPCGPPDAPGYGSFYPQKKHYSIGTVVRFSCKDGFLLKGYSFTKCIYSRSLRKAVWKFNTPVCKRELAINNYTFNNPKLQHSMQVSHALSLSIHGMEM